MNAFWWIAGDCLGFRRATAVSNATGKPYQLASELRHEDILPYPQQVERLACSGFALWDVIASCERPGSLDQDIRKDQPNQVRQFCHQHRDSLQRIVLANGGTSSAKFSKHFRDWLESGELMALPNHEASLKAFGSSIQRGEKKRVKAGNSTAPTDKIILISALGVSPAAARYSYAEKRDFWEEHVYKPGLSDLEAHQEKFRRE